MKNSILIILTQLFFLNYSHLYSQINKGAYTDCQLETARTSSNSSVTAAKQEIIALANLRLGNTEQTSNASNGIFYILHSYGPDPVAAEAHNNQVWASFEDNEYALQLALAYQMTNNTIYADKALYFLNTWATANIRCYGQNYINFYGGENNLYIPDFTSDYTTPGYYDQSGADYVMNQVMQGFIQAALLLKDYSGWDNNDQMLFTNWVNQSRQYYKRFFLPGYHTNNGIASWGNPEWPYATNVSNCALTHLLLSDIWVEDAASFLNGEGKIYMDYNIEESVRPLTLGGYNINDMLPPEVLRGNNGMWYSAWSLEALSQNAILFENTTGVDYFNYVNNYGATLIDGLDKLFYYSNNVNDWPWLSGREFNPNQIQTGGSISPNRAPRPGYWGGTMFEALANKLDRPSWLTWASPSIPTTFFGTGRTSYCTPTLLPASIGFGTTCEDTTSSCLGDSVFSISVTNTDSSATVTWSGSSNATTWVYVHEQEVYGTHHLASNSSYTYSNLGNNYTFTVYVQGLNNCNTPDSLVFNTFVNQPPIASNVQISGTPSPCETVSLNYNYSDPDGDTQGGYIVVWNIGSTEIQRDTILPPNSFSSPIFTIPSGYQGQQLSAVIHPIDIHGMGGSGVGATSNTLIIGTEISSTEIITSCGDYTWIDGNIYTTNNNTATQVFTASNGCDSIVYLDLTITNNTTYGTDIISSCSSYTWIDGNTYTSDNNTATQTLTSASGCDSIVTLNLNITQLDLTTTLNGITLTANQNGASYQWLICNNNYTLINNETNQNFSAIANGYYAVEVRENNCVDTTDCITVNSVGLNSYNNNSIKIYPNPSKGLINIDLADQKDVTISLFTINGKLIYQKENINNLHQLRVNNARGIYILQLNSKKIISQHKVIIE